MSDSSVRRKTQETAARLESETRDGKLLLRLSGPWSTDSLGKVERQLAALSTRSIRALHIDLGAVTRLDSAAALAVHLTSERFRRAGVEVTLAGAAVETAQMLELVASNLQGEVAPTRRPGFLVGFVEHIGEAAIDFGVTGRDLTSFLGYTLSVFARALVQPRRIRWTALVAQMEQTGFNALPIVGLLSFLIGLVMAYQGADQLARFGAQIFTVNLVAVGMLREMGILLTAIIVAGRSGSAFTAQIGTMRVNEEIDAMSTLGLDPMDVLVLPRVMALVLVLPLLTFYADIMGILGGAVYVLTNLEVSVTQFFRLLQNSVNVWTLSVGLIKAPVFAFVIAMVGCFQGLMVARNAESVGRRTTMAVVHGIFLVIVLDALFSILFSILKI